MSTIETVKNYWENHPLLSHELNNISTDNFFIELDKAKREDSDIFALDYWQFEAFTGKKILDVGCGPGWLTVNYALGGAHVQSIDITEAAVNLTKKHLEFKKTSASVTTGNSESIPYEDNFFDVVVASGTLHHTPDFKRAIAECFRVLKPGGKAKITLYRKGILHAPMVFFFVRLLMKILKVKHPGADLAVNAQSVDDFIRMYDGQNNPVGIAFKNNEWSKILANVGFEVDDICNHFFPVRFVKRGNFVFKIAHMLLDKYFGTMAYFGLSKPQ
jgi:ubiquinone/menaquinone biosynthesis C-methylase UbiE